MKEVARMALQPGMVIGADVIVQGSVVFPAGTEVNKAVIDRLARYCVMCVSVMEEIDFASTHYERIRIGDEFKNFEQQYNNCLMRYRYAMISFINNKIPIPDSFLLGLFQELYSKIPAPASSTLLDYLYSMMPNEDELTFTHCLNSALLAGAFADWVSMNQTDKDTLILCAFYYDIGKLALPYDLLWKPDKLTDEEYKLVKSHPVVGYTTVRDMPLNEHIKNAVILHHERFDGSGYPYRIAGEKIDIFARYIAIIDTYIAMASPRSWRNAKPPFKILETFEQSREKYDPALLIPLMKRIADAQIGSHVRLNDGSVWEVMIVQPQKLSSPILKNEQNQILDLSSNPELEIEKNV